MFKISKKILTVLLILSVGALVFGVKFLANQSRHIAQQVSSTKLPDRAKGNPQASIKIIEFIDFQCPACAKGYQLIHEYLAKNPDKFYVELRYFPLAMHKHGLLSARLGECAVRQQKFWPFMDLLIARQSEWAAMIDPMPSFEAIAEQSGVNNDQIKQCLNDSGIDKVIQADVEEGKIRGVSSTPSYFINHEMVVGTKSLQVKLDELLGINKVSPSKDNP
jgi:protein-disulfide isomerase